jgi:hypothetical protein
VASDNNATEEETHANEVHLLQLLFENKVESNCCNERCQRIEVHSQTVIETSSGGSVHHTYLE